MSPARKSEPLRVALLADGEGVQLLAPALAQGPFTLVAQSGKRAEDGLPDVPWFDDPRVMLAQGGAEALLLATSTKAGVEFADMAAGHNLPVWRMPPLARNFGEATEIVTRVRQRGLAYRVASWWDFIAAEVRWALEQGNGVKPVFSQLYVHAPGPSVQSWRASQTDAAGGVLASDAYGMLEGLVAVRHLPARVSAIVASVRRRPGEVPRETEDVATAILRYDGAHSASINATWDVPPFFESTEHHGAELSVVVESQRVALRSREAQTLAEHGFFPEHFLPEELARFAAAVRDPGKGDFVAANDATLERHTAVTALLQAMYLSARTGQPESPLKLYEAQGWPEPRW